MYSLRDRREVSGRKKNFELVLLVSDSGIEWGYGYEFIMVCVKGIRRILNFCNYISV